MPGAPGLARLPGEHHAAEDDEQHPQHDAAVGRFAERDPGEHRGQHRLQVEQERGVGCGRPLEAEHQSHRRDRAAQHDRRREPGPVGPREAAAGPRAAAGEPEREETDAAAEVEQAGDNDWMRRREELLRERRTRAEQCGRNERERRGAHAFRRGSGRRSCVKAMPRCRSCASRAPVGHVTIRVRF